MKEKYTEASIEIIYLDNMDLIVTSDLTNGGDDGREDGTEFGAMHG